MKLIAYIIAGFVINLILAGIKPDVELSFGGVLFATVIIMLFSEARKGNTL